MLSPLNKTASLLCVCLALIVLNVACLANNTAEIRVEVDNPTIELSPVLYGLFFEDINYAADGGLYAELVQNRSFEYYPVQGWSNRSQSLHPLYAWQRVEQDGGRVELSVSDATPLNENNSKYLNMKLAGDGVAGVRNAGFDGIVLREGAKYDFSLYAKRTPNAPSELQVFLVDEDGSELASGNVIGLSDKWEKYNLELKSAGEASKASLVIVAKGQGELMLDMVSLFPQDTFKGRNNGLRKDLAQALADLKPGFLRFPGGCITHGHGLENTYRWKDTVGDVAHRKPNWNLWGYHQTNGLGYYEYMQLCEDLGATPLPVVPVGVSCGFRQPFEVVPLQELHTWVQDALDLIEFANGPVGSQWGKLRADMGHPEPFGLEYICLGNEEHDTPELRERFPYFVEAIRQQYPEVKIIGTSGLGPEIPLFDLMTRLNVHSTDEHYYMSPSWFAQNADRFDSFDRSQPKVFVGEYASEGNTLQNAVAEAVYLTGIERNADVVDMTCYAPLFAKYDYTQWTAADLIWFDNSKLVKTPNYYVQQLFSTNKGDVYCKNSVNMENDANTAKRYEGAVGLGTWRTTIEVSDAWLNDQPLELDDWNTQGGSFSTESGTMTQGDQHAEGCLAISTASADGESSVFRVRARKTGGDEGFLLVFGDQNSGQHYWWNVGGWENTAHGIERRVHGRSVERLASTIGRIETNRWYDLRVELAPGSIKCYLDGRLVHDYRNPQHEVYVSSTIDKSSGELILKLVNPSSSPIDAKIQIHGARRVAETASLITLSGEATAKNTRGNQPVRPQSQDIAVDKNQKLEMPANSVQVLRLHVQ